MKNKFIHKVILSLPLYAFLIQTSAGMISPQSPVDICILGDSKYENLIKERIQNGDNLEKVSVLLDTNSMLIKQNQNANKSGVLDIVPIGEEYVLTVMNNSIMRSVLQVFKRDRKMSQYTEFNAAIDNTILAILLERQ